MGSTTALFPYTPETSEQFAYALSSNHQPRGTLNLMSQTLLFLPDISGFTKFVQSTELSHSQHIIAELLELLIKSNNMDLVLAEVEGDALFFYKEGPLPTKEELEAQIEAMMVAFYSQLRLLQKNRICPCQACISAPELDLKIIAHAGEVQFMTVQDKPKPFGPEVIQAHRLMKNSVDSDRYVLLSQALATQIGLQEGPQNQDRVFVSGRDSYDEVEVEYQYHVVRQETLDLIPHAPPTRVDLDTAPTFSIKRSFPVTAPELLEFITDYSRRPQWTDGLQGLEYNKDEVTRLGTPHTCIINDKHLNFTTVTKDGAPGQLVYGELTSSAAPIDQLYLFYLIDSDGDSACSLEFQAYMQGSALWKKGLIFLMSSMFKKNMGQGLDLLLEAVQNAPSSDASAS